MCFWVNLNMVIVSSQIFILYLHVPLQKYSILTRLYHMHNSKVFFLPLETRPKEYPPLEEMVGRFWHTGIIYENMVYECFNHGRYSVTDFGSGKKEVLKLMNAEFFEASIDEERMMSELTAGISCSEYVARVVGLSLNNGSVKQYWPEEVYTYLKTRK